MLLNLNILDLAVVKSLDLDLAKGMSVLTGETGAGKSILLTALGLALGERADSGYIRPGCKRAEVNLEFDLSDAFQAQQWLIENQLEDGLNCIIRRVVNEDGRSKAYINNRPVTLQSLQALSEKLVEIHGQHAHLTLLDSEIQRQLLDNFGKTSNLLEQVNSCYRQWHDANRELSKLTKASTDQSEREDMLRYQINELQQLDLSNFNYAQVNEEHTKLANLEQILSIGQRQLDLLYENDQHAICNLLYRSINELNQAARYAPELSQTSALLTEAHSLSEEAAQQLRHFLDAQDIESNRLESLEKQIGIIQSLSRKHHSDPEQLPALACQLEAELDGLAHSSERIDSLRALTATKLTEYNKLAMALSTQRQLAGEQLQQQISAMIKELGMPQGEFLVNIQPLEDPTPKLNGMDKIEFLVSANPGLPAKALAKVASGGELSRISLAIQVTTSNDKTTPTMIFDEVDSGIGGAIAEIVGQKLRRLSLNRQVMCVTHLPQVAAQAHTHLYVEKNSQSTDITASTVKILNADERVEEIARMLGGLNITQNTLAHAKEMLAIGNQNQ
ncbi:MAG: DNA repair protein RecN [Methylococcaceae bacterium]|jgi:DNA repair protein RecN (Recombination protein N)